MNLKPSNFKRVSFPCFMGGLARLVCWTLKRLRGGGYPACSLALKSYMKMLAFTRTIPYLLQVCKANLIEKRMNSPRVTLEIPNVSDTSTQGNTQNSYDSRWNLLSYTYILQNNTPLLLLLTYKRQSGEGIAASPSYKAQR